LVPTDNFSVDQIWRKSVEWCVSLWLLLLLRPVIVDILIHFELRGFAIR